MKPTSTIPLLIVFIIVTAFGDDVMPDHGHFVSCIQGVISGIIVGIAWEGRKTRTEGISEE